MKGKSVLVVACVLFIFGSMGASCEVNVPLPPAECYTDDDCYDYVDCTLDLCENGICGHYDDGWCGPGYYCDLYLDCQPVAVVYDSDGDGVEDSVDNCWEIYNPWQEDFDWDGWGYACDCDDYNFYVNPGVYDWCDGWDSNCDGWDC